MFVTHRKYIKLSLQLLRERKQLMEYEWQVKQLLADKDMLQKLFFLHKGMSDRLQYNLDHPRAEDGRFTTTKQK